MKKNLLKLFVLFILAGAVTFSCKKREETTPNPESDYQTAQDDVYAQQSITQTFTSVNNYGINDEGIKTRPYYITVEVLNQNTGWPKKMTINFDLITGTTAADLAEKANRSGIIYAEFSGPWKKDPAPGTSLTVTFNNYKVKGVKYEGTITVTYDGVNSAGGPKFHVVATNMKFTFANSETMTWSTDRYISWIAGFDELVQSDIGNFKYELWGSNSGTNSKGSTYSAVISQNTPLLFRYCPDMLPITKGTITITQNGVTKTINFGDTDTCDNKVTITISGITIDLTLRS
ncbi:MAG: hypothetical protein HY958_02655 [Bacteroidia bacterium]|nr:hypothetical protein [Bacteroidia bacterium]